MHKSSIHFKNSIIQEESFKLDENWWFYSRFLLLLDILQGNEWKLHIFKQPTDQKVKTWVFAQNLLKIDPRTPPRSFRNTYLVFLKWISVKKLSLRHLTQTSGWISLIGDEDQHKSTNTPTQPLFTTILDSNNRENYFDKWKRSA